MRRRLILLPVLATLAGLLLWAFLPRPIAVETRPVTRGALTVWTDAEGTAQVRDVRTISAPITGTLQRIGWHAGDAVAAGDIVARIGPARPPLLDQRAKAMAEAAATAAAASVDLARTEQERAKAALAHALAERDRSRQLHARGVIAQRMLDDAELAAAAARDDATAAAANLAIRLQELASARALLATADGPAQQGCCVDVVAPIAGRILRILQDDEQVVAAGTPLLELGDTTDMDIVADLLSRDAVALNRGAAAVVTGWGGPDLAARLERVDPAARTEISALGIAEQRVQVLLALRDPPPPTLGHDFELRVRITLWQGRNLLTVPVAALFRDGADWAVFSVQNRRATLTRLQIGHRNDDMAEVRDGLNEGDSVVLYPDDTIADGTRVAPIP